MEPSGWQRACRKVGGEPRTEWLDQRFVPLVVFFGRVGRLDFFAKGRGGEGLISHITVKFYPIFCTL